MSQVQQIHPQEPEGYSVYRADNGSYAWKSDSDPVGEQCSGFVTYSEALTHCRESQLPYPTYQ